MAAPLSVFLLVFTKQTDIFWIVFLFNISDLWYEKYLQQLEEAGKIRNLAQTTFTCYKNYVSVFLKYMHKVPEELTCQDVRLFLLEKKDSGLKAATINLYNSSIRFFYRNVLPILWDDITVPRMILDHKLPTVLSLDEINRLLDATEDIKYRTMFATIPDILNPVILSNQKLLYDALYHAASATKSKYVFQSYQWLNCLFVL